VLHTLLPVLLRRRDDGVDQPFADAGLQRLAAGLLRQLSPRDAWYEGHRHLLPFGDHSIQVSVYRELYRTLADGFAPFAPELAQNLAWAYREMGGEAFMRESPRPIPWVDGHLQGLGSCLRGRDEHGSETLLALRAGGAWAHHHADDGSIQLIAGGRSLVVDAAWSCFQHDMRRKLEDHGHSRWCLRELRQANFLWRFSRGWVVDQALDQALAFVSAYLPVTLAMTRSGTQDPLLLPQPIDHWRHVLRLTPSSWVVIDVSASQEAQDVHWHLPTDGVHIEGDRATVTHAPDCRFSVIPLHAITVPTIRIDRPRTGHKHAQPGLSTTDLCYAVPPLSLFLLQLDRETDVEVEI
jgi:hypothetical protein